MFKRQKIEHENTNTAKQEEKDSDQGVNIEGLPEERVLIALFSNVYKKSQISFIDFVKFADNCYYRNAKASIGMDGPPDEDQARKILSENEYVTRVGPVSFHIKFGGKTIDTTRYDEDHKTSVNPEVKTAKVCIAELRSAIELEKVKAAEEEARLKAEKAEEEKRKELRDNANKLIGKLLANDNCKIGGGYSNFCLVFESKQTLESLQQYATTLTEAGLLVKLVKEKLFPNGVINIASHLNLLDPLEVVVAKLSAYFSQSEQLQYAKVQLQP